MCSSTDSDALRAKLQLYFINIIKNLDKVKLQMDDMFRFVKIVDVLINTNDSNEYLNDSTIQEFKQDFDHFSFIQVSNEFKRSFYSICLHEIFVKFDPVLFADESFAQNSGALKNLLTKIISKGNYSDSFNVIYDLCVGLKGSQQRDICLDFVKIFLKKNLIKMLFIEKCQQSNDRQFNNLIEDSLVQKICNLPDKFSNLIGLNYPTNSLKNYSLFLPKNYFKIIAADLWGCLSFLQSVQKIDSINLQFISNIYGKISFLGHSDVMVEYFLKFLISSCYVNDQWKSICKKFFDSMSSNYQESSILNLINISSSYEDLQITLDDLVTTNPNIKYFFMDKFFFLKIFKNEKAIQNLIGYLYESPAGRSMYYELFRKLLNAWSTKASLINTPYEQHLYLTKCIIVCVSFMDDKDKDELASQLIKSLLEGVEKHLSSPNESIRTLGMCVGENLMNEFTNLTSSESKRLKFEYEQTDEVRVLLSLRTRPSSESAFRKSSSDKKDELVNLEILQNTPEEKVIFKNANLNINITQTEKDSDDDDDDDLKPYDLSNDVPLSTNKQPAYLRDCMEALIFSEDPDKVELSLKSVPKLCDTYHYELEEICAELVKVLLHKGNNYAIENFEDLKLNAMISVTVHYPKECAQYLTSQFYEQGYSLAQRTDILHVLTMSVQKISDPNVEPAFDSRILDSEVHPYSPVKFLSSPQISEKSDWREVVKKRIEQKTKYKKTPGKQPKTTKTKENKYSDVYGYFFFPLLNSYDNTRVHLNIVEQDFILLGKLIFSLGVMLYSAQNTTVLENMISALTEFVWTLRNHVEPFVRKSIIFAFTIILMVVNDSQLFHSLNNYFSELKHWLESVLMNDANIECQQRTRDCLGILNQRVKQRLLNTTS